MERTVVRKVKWERNPSIFTSPPPLTSTDVPLYCSPYRPLILENELHLDDWRHFRWNCDYPLVWASKDASQARFCFFRTSSIVRSVSWSICYKLRSEHFHFDHWFKKLFRHSDKKTWLIWWGNFRAARRICGYSIQSDKILNTLGSIFTHNTFWSLKTKQSANWMNHTDQRTKVLSQWSCNRE